MSRPGSFWVKGSSSSVDVEPGLSGPDILASWRRLGCAGGVTSRPAWLLPASAVASTTKGAAGAFKGLVKSLLTAFFNPGSWGAEGLLFSFHFNFY